MRSGVERAVIDTNVWVAGFINPAGHPGAVLQALVAGELVAVSAPALILEAREVLQRSRIRDKYSLVEREVAEMLELLEVVADDPDIPPVRLRDHDDEVLLAVAVHAAVDVIITGDRDLLDDEEAREWLLGQGIRVVTPAQWLFDT